MSLLDKDYRNGVLTFTLRNPPLNIFTIAMMNEWEEALKNFPADARVVLVRGEGKHFCAGADIEEHLPSKGGEKMLTALGGFFTTFESIPVPVISLVRGACLGAGLEIATASDWMIVTEDAKLGVPEIALGVMPPIAAVDLPLRIGPNRAAELVYTGKPIRGTEAKAIGLANDALSPEALDAREGELREQFSGLSATAVRAAKRALRETRCRPYPEAIRTALNLYASNILLSHDGVEGLKAFLEKRKPLWKHS